ncbi:hypothetical protein BDN67DRAFT_799552 [Paxillus ammoniavirescens]|nr:hypothetical protein BDN67DRAFT_799552 [Paxillus ammoniavirescens]
MEKVPEGLWTNVGSSDLPSDVPVALGYALSILLYGILVVQTFIYHTRFSKDSNWIRIYVWIVSGLETLSFAFALYDMLRGASIHCLSCIPLSLSTPLSSHWTFGSISILTGLISLMAHGFYSWRIRVIGRSWYVPIFVMMISLMQCIILVIGAIHGNLILGSLGIPDIWMGANFLCDLTITIETTRLLFRRGAMSSLKDTRGLVRKLIKLTVETGAVTTVAILLQFLLSLHRNNPISAGTTVVNLPPSVVQLSVFYSISRLYANCLFATLNARLIISRDSTRVHQVSTTLFDVPPSTIVSKRPTGNYVNMTISQSHLDTGSLTASNLRWNLHDLTTSLTGYW